VALWKQLLENGAAQALNLRTGCAGYAAPGSGLPLYDHELTEDRTPLEANMEWVVKWNKGAFVGREALEKQKQEGL